MYRYSVDNAVTYTPSDFKLFRESPFAIWMERLSLENPDHGILPDLNSAPPQDDALPQDDLVETLREEGRDVVLVDWTIDESERRADTLHAMRSGADFIVNGTLALGPLSGNANLLMRTSGFSDFGNYLYVPCDTQERAVLDSTMRLCFLADMLHSLQGQLPPQLLLVRGEAEVTPLQTEDHIYYYRAVKMRFMEAMRTFRKHRMPDPSDSSHFGRWSDCAGEVLKQRAVSADYQRYEQEWGEDEVAPEQVKQSTPDLAEEIVEPVVQERPQEDLQESQAVATEAVVAQAGARARGAVGIPTVGRTVAPLHDYAGRDPGSATLADRALKLVPGTYKSAPLRGHTPNLARFPRRIKDKPARTVEEVVQVEPITPTKGFMAPVETAERDGEFRDTLEDALNNLAFIGSNLIARPNEKPSEKRSEEHREKRDEQPVGEPVEQRIDNAADVQRTVHASSNETAAQDIETIEPSGMAGATAARPIEETVAGNAGISGSTDFLEQLGVEAESAPPPNLRDVVHPEPRIEGYEVELIDFESLELEPREPLLLPPETALEERIALERKSKAGRQAIDYDIESLVDLDSVPPPTLAPVKSSAPVSDADPHAERVQAREPADTFTRGEWEEEVIVTAKRTERFVRESSSDAAEEPAASTPGFSSSLITNQTFKDKD